MTRITHVLLMISMSVTLISPSQSEDIVLTQKNKSAPVGKRKGEIVEWKGSSLQLNSNGRIRTIDNNEIVGIETKWPAEYDSAMILMSGGDYVKAYQQLRNALNQERRPWASRIILADIIECLDALDTQKNDQVRAFLAIVDGDPDTRFVDRIPLRWTVSLGTENVARQLESKLDSNSPMTQLVAASWLLSGNQRNEAIKALNELANDINPNIAALAQAQLWKATPTNTSLPDLKRFSKRIERMPRFVRAGPYYVLAEMQTRSAQFDQAAINLMRIPILYPKQHSLAAAALFQTGDLMQNNDKTTEARTVWMELVQKHPHSLWAKQAADKLNSRTTND